jgi:N-carbamoylputrescine amidase
MRCEDGQVEHNLGRATGFVTRAVDDGARLVLLPELMPIGFRMTEEIWEAAEPREGATVRWLRHNGRALGIWIDTSFLERDGEDFYNTFVLAGPEGTDLLRVRKEWPAAMEAYFYRAGAGARAADTEVGRIGVSSCYEQMIAAVVRRLHVDRPDIVLLPHSAPRVRAQLGFSEKDVAAYMRLLTEAPSFIAAALGVPVVMANKVGRWQTPMPSIFPAEDTVFAGGSTIVDADGTEKVRLGDEEGVAVAEVTIDRRRPRPALPALGRRWSRPMPWFTRVWPAAKVMGGLSYRLNRTRRTKARSIASSGSQAASLKMVK